MQRACSSTVKRTPFVLPSSPAVTTPKPVHGIVAQATSADGKEVMKLVPIPVQQSWAISGEKPIPTSSLSVAAPQRAGAPVKTTLHFDDPFAALRRLISQEECERHAVVGDEVSFASLLTFVGDQLASRLRPSLLSDEEPIRKSHRTDSERRLSGRGSSDGRQVDDVRLGTSQRESSEGTRDTLRAHSDLATTLWKSWAAPNPSWDAGRRRADWLVAVEQVLDGVDPSSWSTSIFQASQCFPLQLASEATIVAGLCHRIALSCNVSTDSGYADLLLLLATDVLSIHMDTAVQCFLLNLRQHGHVDAERLRVAVGLLEVTQARRITHSETDSMFVHSLLMLAIAVVGTHTTRCETSGSHGSPLWFAVRLLWSVSTRLRVGTVRVEDRASVYRAIHVLTCNEQQLTSALGEHPYVSIMKLLVSTIDENT